ncbi:MAG: sulfite exporter TauE/SafE family protein [Thermoguttaceae bacterium]
MLTIRFVELTSCLEKTSFCVFQTNKLIHPKPKRMEITVTAITIGLVAAFCTGISKSGVPGCGMLGVVIMAMAFGSQAKLSAGAVVPLLIVADFLALPYYYRSCDWTKIRLLALPVLVGFAIGAVVLNMVDDRVFGVTLGVFVLVMTALELLRTRLGWNDFPHAVWFAWVMGSLGGASTVIANAAGPVMIVYITSLGLSKEKMMGTITVFFFLVNVTKLPIVTSLGLVSGQSLLFDLCLVPGVLVGSFVGRRIYLLIPERFFAPLVTILNILAAVMLI